MLGFFSVENDQRRAAVGFIAEGNHRRMFFEQRVDDLALYTNAAAVDDTNFTKTFLHCLIQVLLHNDMDLVRLERVKVDGILDRDVVHSESI